jgi:predicted SprT family Zn-dependent metalloprotease
MRSVGVENMTWNLRSKIKVLNECDRRKFTKTTQVYKKRGKPIGKEFIGKKKAEGEKVGPIYAHGGCVTKKG